ncbi:caspase family protein [Streptomyces sp. B21-083]|uniref:caspase family protein n=1 Tax=Streptomyces sp. B21-083 TaxID=3039410 RepID=UPI002FEF8146
MSGPNGAPRGSEGPRRYLIATAVARYLKCADWDRPELVEAREQVIELFTQQLGYDHYTALGLDPTRLQLTDQLRAFCTSQERREDDLVVLYLSGHGEVLEDGHEHVLLMADTDPSDVSYTSLPTVNLVRALRGTKVRRLLLMLDTCYSGQGGNELAAAALERLGAQWGPGTPSPGLVVVSSAQPHQQAKAGLFPRLLKEAVGSQAAAGHAPVHLSVSAVVQQMNDHPDRPGYQHINLSLLGLTGEPPDFLTNPRHDIRLTDVDLALQDAAEFDAYALQRETEFTTRLLVRAMGYHGDPALGWWFCGRHQVLAELATWLNQTGDSAPEEPVPPDVLADGCVRVVMAGPGSGKTAVLGLVGALTMPDRRRAVPLGSLGLDPDWVPGEGMIDVIMYAQNLTDSQVLAGLAAAAGFRCTTVGEFLEALEHRNQDRGRPFTVLIDALDEAATPATLCSQIVRPLIEHSRGRIRLLLGTRPHLLDCLGLSNRPAHRGGPVIDLDSDRYADREALLSYTIRNLVQSCPTAPYRLEENRALLRPVAEAVAAAAGMSFLVARFAAYTLASADTAVTDPFDPHWRDSLPRHAGQAMHDDLNQRLGPDAQRVTDLLRPLAYAEGQGLPWEDIWAPLASAVSGRPYTDDDLLWLRRNAGSYVVEATENGRSAYRLYHQALTEHLREDTDPTPVHAAFVDTLTDRVPYRGDATRDWSRAHPYTLHHLATHTAASGRIDDLLSNAEYLIHADPHSLTPHLRRASSRQARLTAAVYRNSFDLHADASVSIRRSVLALNAARAGATTLLAQLNRCAHATEWIPAWATGNDFAHALRTSITGLDRGVVGIACSVLEDLPVGLISGRDGVSVWDLSAGRRISKPLTDRMVGSLACSVLADRPVAVIAGGNTVTVSDLASGRLICKPFVHGPGPVVAMACTVLSGRPVAVIGGDTVTVWDLASGRRIGEPFTPGRSPVRSISCSLLDGGAVAVISGLRFDGGSAGTVSVWDLATGRRVGTSFAPGHRPVASVSCATLDGQPVAVTADGTVEVWDLATGHHLRRFLAPYDDMVRSVACTVLDGRPVVVAAGARVAVWDLATGRRIGRPLIHPGGPADTLECTVLDDRPVAVTGSSIGTVRVWDLSDLASPDDPRAVSDNAFMSSVACTTLNGQLVAVTGGETVSIWDLASGQRISQSPALEGDCARSVSCTVLGDRPVAVTGGETVSIWDLASGQRISSLSISQDGPVHSLACSTVDGRPVAAIGGDGTVSMWDLASGHRIGRSDTPAGGHWSSRVHTVACTMLDGRATVVTGGPALSMWDLTTARRIGEPYVQEGLGLIRFDGHSRSGVLPREDVHHGEHGEEEASPSPFVHAGVQGRDRRAVPTR